MVYSIIMGLTYGYMHHATVEPFVGLSESYICLSNNIFDSAMLQDRELVYISIIVCITCCRRRCNIIRGMF